VNSRVLGPGAFLQQLKKIPKNLLMTDEKEILHFRAVLELIEVKQLDEDEYPTPTPFKPLLNFIILGGNSQNFLRKFLIFFLTLGLKILRL